MPRLFLLALWLAAQASAEQFMLDYALPRGGSRGTTVEVTLHGQFLDDPREVLFYRPGIKATQLIPGSKPSQDVKVRFEIAADCPLGEHPLRLRTATALSEAVTFWVSPFPTVMETEKKAGENDTLEKAQPVPMNSTVEGQIHPGDQPDRDYYRVEVKEAQRISVEVEAVRLGTLHIGGDTDLAVRILDAGGKELGRADDSAMYVQDPVLSVLAPRAGSYFIEVKQQMYEPPRMAYYRVHIGSFLRPTGIYPAGGQAGEQLSVHVLGDPAGARADVVRLPRKTGDFEYFAGEKGERPPSPNILRVSPYPNVFESRSDAPAAVAALPAALNGIVSKPGEVDTFRFPAKKGQAWQVRVFARTLGSPMDPKIWIRAANATKNLIEADDCKLADLGYVSARGSWFIKDTLDPVTVFRPPADGEYLLGVEDTRGAGSANHIYRVEIEPVRDTIYTHITGPEGYQIPRLTGLIVPQGNRWTLDVQLAAGLGNNYKGEMELEALGLPPGVRMIAPRFGKGVTRLPVQFVAADGMAEQGSALVELRAKPVEGSAKVESGSRQGFSLVNRPGEYPWHFVFLDRFALAVTQPAPFHVEMEDPGIPLAKSGELSLKVRVIRHGDFKGAVEIQPDWLPPGVSREGTVTIAADKTEGAFKIRADAKAAPGKYQIAMNASTTGGDAFSGAGRIRVSSEFLPLEVSEPYLTVDLKRASVERGQRGQIVGTLQQSKQFPGAATATLRNLPKGVAMTGAAQQITAKDNQVVFPIEAQTDALAGLYKDISCEVTVVENGQSIRQQTGSGVLRVDPGRGAVSR